MKYAKLVLSIMIVTALLVSIWVPSTNPMTSNELVHEPSQKSVLSYVPHDYILIINDTDLVATAANESWPGDGSAENPFLIQGYEIIPMFEDITIHDTRLHLKIVDCNITGALGGIFLENVTNVVIQNCLFSDNGYGVYMLNVTEVDVIGCSFSFPTWGETGVYMQLAIDCSIQSCVMQGTTGTDAGIYGEDSEGITLYNNTIFEFDNHGISFIVCYDMDIIDNTLYLNKGSGGGGPTCGIQIAFSQLANIIGNNITDNMDNGITISGTDNVTIVDNYIYYSSIHGIYVEFSEYCSIQDNYIAYSGEGIIEGPACGIFAYYADNCQIIGNEFWRNIMNHITVGYSDFCYISNNFLNESFNHGIELYTSHNATIEENEIYRSYGYGSVPACGIFVEECDDALLIHNTLGHNSENGITIVASSSGEAIGNTIYDSEYNGLFLTEVSDWTITHNIIYDNGGPGIYLDVPTADNILYYNDIGWSGEFLVVDEGFGNYWNYSGVGNWYSDYGGTGVYNISGASAEIDYYPSVSLYLGTTTPYEYEAGTTGNTMTWAASALNPGTYELLIDSVSQGHVVWDGVNIEADVDGLEVGTYNVTIIAYHISGHWMVNQSTLTVVDTEAPTWTVTPSNQVIDYNVPLSYQLEASDPSGIASWAVNDTINFAISASGLLTNVTALVPGVYYVEVTVTDVYAHSVSVSIMITVTEPASPASPINPMLILAIGAGGVGVAIVVIVIIIKKKSG